jgi:hypothetical protein
MRISSACPSPSDAHRLVGFFIFSPLLVDLIECEILPTFERVKKNCITSDRRYSGYQWWCQTG